MKSPESRPATSTPRRPRAGGRSAAAIPNQKPGAKSAGGRPPKYAEPSRPITVTLPESVLEGLKHIHPDRGLAIVKLAEAALRRAPHGPPLIEIVEMVANTGLLVVGSCEALRSIPFLHLVEVAPGRFLLAMDPGNDFKTLEIAIRDVLDDVPAEQGRERTLLTQLLEHIKQVRQSERVSMAEILFVKLGGKRRPVALHSFMHTMAWLLASAA